MLPLPRVDPSKISWSQIGIDVLMPMLAIILIIKGLWVMPLGLFVLFYALILGAGFGVAYVEHRIETRHTAGLYTHCVIAPYWSGDSFKPPARARELHLAIMTRSVKEHHAHDLRRS